MRRLRVLLVDDNPQFLERFQAFGKAFFDVTTAQSGQEGLRKFSSDPPEAVLLDVDLGSEPNGLDVLRRIREDDRDVPIVMVTSDERLETAIAAMKAGANDYVPKHQNMEALHLKIQQALDQVSWREYARRLDDPDGTQLVGRSRAMTALREELALAGRKNLKVLISGESGSGKGLVARALHRAGPRRGQRFVAMNAASVPEGMFESEILGHERGSFTGADRARIGRLELASGGTFFLDEVDKLSLDRQAKLLHIVEDASIMRLGGREPIDIDIRLITASNRSLHELIAAGTFREDFYYRIAEHEIFVPPLRDRLEDLPDLVRALLAREVSRADGEPPRMVDGAIDLLQQHAWPGNVRELSNVLKRAILFSQADHDITIDGVRLALESVQRRIVLATRIAPASVKEIEGDGDRFLTRYMQGGYDEGLDSLERDYARSFVRRELTRFAGNKSRAAEKLDIKRDKLYKLMKDYGIGDPDAPS